jgi:hypothetical protein
MSFNQQKESAKSMEHREKMSLEQQKLAQQRQMKDIDLQIARENQTASEIKAKKKTK